MKQKSLTKSEIIALVIGFLALVIAILQLFIMLLPWFGVYPPEKPMNVSYKIFNILFLKIPIIWIIFLCSVIYFIGHIILRRRNKAVDFGETSKDKINFGKMIQNEIEIYIRAEGEQIHFFIDSYEALKLRIWFMVINKSFIEVILDKIEWELRIGQFVKEDVTQLPSKIEAKETKKDILIKADLNESELSCLRSLGNDITYRCFSGTAFFMVNGKFYEKSFRFENINYSTDKKITKEQDLNLSKEHQWALLILLNQSNKTYLRYDLERDYKDGFHKTTADFNILESELKKWNLINYVTGMQGKYWELTNLGLEIISKLHRSNSKS